MVKDMETLEREVNKFANEQPYWAKFLAEKILSDKIISDSNINTSYSFLLEELGLKEKTKKHVITIGYKAANSGNYIPDLLFSKLENVEGVNALIENQTFEFNRNLTIIYGANGSGKSGYVRLLKNAFYSKSTEEIIPNIYIESGHKPIKAIFTFNSAGNNLPVLQFPRNEDSIEFEHFAVFDGKSVFSHLEQRNEFEFRPAGLSFFSKYTEAIKLIEEKLNIEIQNTQSENQFGLWFEGESEIKFLVENLSAETKNKDLKKYTPYTIEDKSEKIIIQKQYDELLIATRSKDTQIENLQNIKKLLGANKSYIEKLNRFFTNEYLNSIKDAIADCKKKEETAKTEGIEKFKTDKIEDIGTIEWKNFIKAAESFAKKQKYEKGAYPKSGDNCLLCHQPLSEDAKDLITNYWLFIKSVAEENARKSQEVLSEVKQGYEKLIFNVFSEDNILTIWLTEYYPKIIENLKRVLSAQEILSKKIISDIKSKSSNTRDEIKISMSDYDKIEISIDTTFQTFKNNEQGKELERLLKAKTFLEHKKIFNSHFSKFETYVYDQIWIKKAGKANFSKRKITETEKTLSDKYFNQKYIETFNEECIKLNGTFGIEINHTGSAGRSYRQLKLKGRNPNTVLSEGEKKVIAIADFITEMELSEINRGIIFDDPVSSLDERRKSEIAKRLVEGSKAKQTIVFTHDLVFVSSLIGHCSDLKVDHSCHWVEKRDDKPGQVWLNNSPSYEKIYRNAEPAKKYYIEAKKDECPPSQREYLLKAGFAALRTSYEVLVINDLFKNVVKRFNERVSIDSLSAVYFDNELIEEVQESFNKCCRYMEGHTHSDKYAYKKPEPINLNKEIQRFESLRTKIRKIKKPA